MLSIYDQGPPPPCPNPFNLAAHVLAEADAHPDKLALAIIGLNNAERWSYARLQAAVLGTASGLRDMGLAPGDIALLRLGNSVEFPIAYLGAIAAGLVPVPTSSQLTAREVAKIAADLSPRAVFLGDGIACPDLPGVAMIDEAALTAMRDLPPAAYDMGDPDRIAYIVYTSGTSGNSRAVAHAHRAIWARQMMHVGWYGLTSEDRLCHAGAFNWTYTLGTGLMDPWSVGATALIPAAGVDPQALPLLLKRHEATVFAAAPGVYRKILNHHAKIDLPQLRHGLTAGEKISDALRAEWNAAAGGKLYEAFGMSECSTFISGSPTTPARPGMLGAPQVGRRVAIVDADGTPVPMGEIGIIAVARRDPGLMLGYIGAEAETAARMRGEWFLTGDLGRMEPDGQIAYQGRDDDMMNAGGYRVSPLEVEAALSDIGGISEIGVTDVEVKTDARLIWAFYTGPEPLDEKALQRIAGERLARYKQPRGFQYLPELPRNPNGKLKRRALAPLWQASDAAS
ncbi:class I adenylate-forming enzyme family protein [Pseudooceanicola sp.]|uniref:class I adenylate-forming enzyme family protein n=1 Tax=Pseudooceanicola sp. TaxID=1914328 RepID=UPI002609C275|nr:class I adenylate-forming enzyme family protein [Pseudooceanicola sp.]MDF1854087.1 class I adenylate-forming enzyme family protein [Pseudooceanicola sp.]